MSTGEKEGEASEAVVVPGVTEDRARNGDALLLPRVTPDVGSTRGGYLGTQPRVG